jgi:hypothetical protein
MNERSKVIFILGFFLPLFVLIIFAGAGYYAYSDISTTWEYRKGVYDKMQEQKKTLEAAKEEREVYEKWLPTFRSWYNPEMLGFLGRELTNKCVEENGLTLRSASQRQAPPQFPGGSAQSFSFLGRSGSMIQFIGDAQVHFPSVYPEAWDMTKDSAKGFIILNITFVLPENTALK